MKSAQLGDKPVEELIEMSVAKRADLQEAQVKIRTEEVKDVRQIRSLKRELAQILTAKRERELAAQEQKLTRQNFPQNQSANSVNSSNANDSAGTAPESLGG
jgi:ribosomal protein L29